jgi:molybdopterin molybdotransferase
MARITDDCFVPGEHMMRTDEAIERITGGLAPAVETERVALTQALGRILAEDTTSPMDVPPHNNSAVDGYGVFFDDLHADKPTRLPISGRAAAGHPLEGTAHPGAAIRIFTGAPMPEGPDTVLMQEHCETEGEILIVPPGIRRGANYRRAGEDVAAGEVVMRQGRRLRPQEVGLIASLGHTDVAVYQPLKVALFSTGDEVVEPGRELPPGSIYDANRYIIASLLRDLGCEVTDLGILPDCARTITDSLAGAAKAHDLIFTSGGVSVGEEDYVKQAVNELGQLHLWRIAIKPGRPIAFGQVAGVPFIGLPGNPVAAMVTFLRIARPVVLRLSGCADIAPVLFQVTCGFSMTKKAARREWVRARLERDPNGALIATRFPRQGSGILLSMVEADGLIELSEEQTEIAKGALVDFLPFNEVRR